MRLLNHIDVNLNSFEMRGVMAVASQGGILLFTDTNRLYNGLLACSCRRLSLTLIYKWVLTGWGEGQIRMNTWEINGRNSGIVPSLSVINARGRHQAVSRQSNSDMMCQNKGGGCLGTWWTPPGSAHVFVLYISTGPSIMPINRWLINSHWGSCWILSAPLYA